MRDEHRVWVFKNRVLRNIAGCNREQVAVYRIKLCNYEFHNLHSSSDIIRMIQPRTMRWVCHIACIMRKMCIDFWWEHPILLGKTRHERKDNINTDVKETG